MRWGGKWRCRFDVDADNLSWASGVSGGLGAEGGNDVHDAYESMAFE